MSTEHEGSAFGPSGDSTVNFGQPGLTPEQESGFSPGGFAAQVSADDDRITPDNVLARPAHRPVASIPPMPGVVPAPPPPLTPIFAPVTSPVAPVPPVPASGVLPVPPTPAQPPSVTDPVQPFAPVNPSPQFDPHPAPPATPAPTTPPVAASVAGWEQGLSQPNPTTPVAPVPAAVPLAAPVEAPVPEPMFSNTHGFTGSLANPILSPAPVPPKPRRLKRLVPLVVLPLALVVGGGAFAAYKVGVFGAPGAQPSAVAPANTLAYAAVDFNPSAKAKLGAYEFSQAFESGKGFGKTTFKDDLLAKVFPDSDVDPFHYAADVAPWVGDRMAMAAVPAPNTEEGVTALAIIEQTDVKVAEASLTKWQNRVDDDETVYWAFKDDYVLIGIDKAAVAAASKAETSLDDNTTYTHDKAVLGEDALAHAWVNTTALVDALPADVTAEVPAETLTRLDGSLIVGTTLTGDHLEVTGHGFGYEAPGTTQPVAHLKALPADASVAFEVTGLGESLSTAWAEYAKDDTFGIGDSAQEFGLVLPDDLLALFGADFAVAASGYDADPQVSVLATTADPERAVALIKDGRKQAGADVKARITGDGYVASYGEPGKDGGLGQNPVFTKAVPNAANAHMFGFINLAEILGLARTEYTTMSSDAAGAATAAESIETAPAEPKTDESDPWKDAEALEAIGISATTNGDTSSFTFRLTLKD